MGNFLLLLYRLAGLCHVLMMIDTPAYLGVSAGNLLS